MVASCVLVRFIKWLIFKCVVHLNNILIKIFKNVELVKVKLTKLVYYVVSKISTFHTLNQESAVVTVYVITSTFIKLLIAAKVCLIPSVKYQVSNQLFVVVNISLIVSVMFVHDFVQILKLARQVMLWNAGKFVNKTQSTSVIWINVWVVIILVLDVHLLSITVHVQIVHKVTWWSIGFVSVVE